MHVGATWRIRWDNLCGGITVAAYFVAVVITFTSSTASSVTTASPWPRQRLRQQQQQQQGAAGAGAAQWRPDTLILCHSVVEANATSDFFVAETFVLDGWSVHAIICLQRRIACVIRNTGCCYAYLDTAWSVCLCIGHDRGPCKD